MLQPKLRKKIHHAAKLLWKLGNGNYVLDKNGIVFGAVFDKDFNVIIKSTDSDISQMMQSKYVSSNTKDTFKECKEFLEKGKLVLYSGLPCQIYGLKAYLEKEYDNLITLDVFCHGVPSNKVWHKYLDSFGKKITKVNFRDKSESWEQFHLRIDFSDGTYISENHHNNKYMQLFLKNEILRRSCFSCTLRSHQISDISIGDAWGLTTEFNDHKGVSSIIVHSEKGANILKQLSFIKTEASKNFMEKSVNIKWQMPKTRETTLKQLTSSKIAIITIPGHENVGNTLQAFALQSKIKEILPDSQPIVINQKDQSKLLSFYKNNVAFTDKGFDDSYSILVVGSDQIWIPNVWPGVPFEDQFLMRNCPKKIVYAASFGKHTVRFNDLQKQKIHDSLKSVKYIGTREISGSWLVKKFFNIENAVPVLDPTMLYNKDFYLAAAKLHASENKCGIFAYILDKSNEWNIVCNKLSNQLNEPILPYNGSVESFLDNMNKAKCVITDSYHGSVFSIIFTLRNMKRGNDRFDDLSMRFSIDNRFVSNLQFDNNLLTKEPNINLDKSRAESISFLENALLEFSC